MKRMVLALAGLFCAAQAAAQTAQALDLRIPEAPLYGAAPPATRGDPPGTYHGDTRGAPSRDEPATQAPADDGKAQVWGSVTTGIGHSKGHGTSHYNAAEINVSKSYGEGERPANLNLQIRVEQSDGPGFGDRQPYPYFGPEPYWPSR